MLTELKLSYKNKKLIKKLYGKNKAREISFGRKLVKIMINIYSKENHER